MRHAIYGSNASEASVAILIKEAAFDTDKIKKSYIGELGANPASFIAYSLWYNDHNKCPANTAKDYLKDVLHSIKQLNIKNIIIADSVYFKYLTKQTKPASSYLGCKVKSQIEDYENEFDVFYTPNYQAAKYNPKTKQELEISMNFFHKFLTGNYVKPGQDIVHSAKYLFTLKDIKEQLDWLKTKPNLTVDIETKGLEFWNCGIATIGFAWDQHNYLTFPVDRGFFSAEIGQTFDKPFGYRVKQLLKDFFIKYDGKLIAHNANFDFKVLVYELWMNDLQDYKGMIDGIQILTRKFDDTKIIKYLATNNAVENVLNLKSSAVEYMGAYQEDVVDTTKVPLQRLLTYNGKDCLATWYVLNKNYPIMVQENQEQLYKDLFKPSIITLLATELVGLPIFPDKVTKAKKELTAIQQQCLSVLDKSSIVREFQLDVKAKKCKEFTEEAKKKVFTMDDPRIQRLVFNPNSPSQVGNLLYNYLDLPILDLTDTKQPATGTKTLVKLLNHTKNQQYLDIIQALIDLSKVEKIITSFIPAFENAVQQPDGSWRLYGNFNLGGTVSGRLSSSSPNLQNLPSGSVFGELIKSCFGCTNGWLFGGADFNSLEDRVSALTTRDPNKMKVYEGHRIYKVTVNGTCHHIRDDATVVLNGESYTGEEFYAKYSGSSTNS